MSENQEQFSQWGVLGLERLRITALVLLVLAGISLGRVKMVSLILSPLLLLFNQIPYSP